MWGMTFERSLRMFSPRSRTDESLIRADERRKMCAELKRYAEGYVEKWTPLIGANRAKATAWEFLVAAKRLARTSEPQRGEHAGPA